MMDMPKVSIPHPRNMSCCVINDINRNLTYITTGAGRERRKLFELRRSFVVHPFLLQAMTHSLFYRFRAENVLF